MAYQFPKREPFTFSWRITDDSTPPVPVNDCDSVTATLYAGRDTDNPDLIPGTPVPSFDNLTLAYTGDSKGNYAVEIGVDPVFNPMASTNYRVVIQAIRDGEAFGEWDEPCSVVVNS